MTTPEQCNACECCDSSRARIRMLEEQVKMLREALEYLQREIVDKYHPGENWFPQFLVIPEVLAKIKEMER